VAVAGAINAAQAGRLAGDARVVCLVTGTGFKDEQSVTEMIAGSACPLLESPDEIESLVGP